jgi:hypothetical protein
LAFVEAAMVPSAVGIVIIVAIRGALVKFSAVLPFALTLLWLTAAPSAAAATGARLDTAYVHDAYLNGDFEIAKNALEDAVKSGGLRSHADSLFTFKHLGVIYAADPDRRERGKYYMYQLLAIEPSARILDMYASDMIYMIFRNVQEEFLANHGAVAPRKPSATAETQPQAAAFSPVPPNPSDTTKAPMSAAAGSRRDTAIAPAPVTPKPAPVGPKPAPIATATAMPAPVSPAPGRDGSSWKKNRLAWVAGAGAAAVVTGGVIVYLLSNKEPAATRVVHDAN